MKRLNLIITDLVLLLFITIAIFTGISLLKMAAIVLGGIACAMAHVGYYRTTHKIY